MVTYNFYLGIGSTQTLCACKTNDNGKIIECDTTPYDDGIDYTIEDVENMYKEILDVIAKNELQNYTIPTGINENQLLKAVLDELNYSVIFHDDNDSDDVFGYSDILSVSENATIHADEMCENYEDILRSIANTGLYLDGMK